MPSIIRDEIGIVTNLGTNEGFVWTYTHPRVYISEDMMFDHVDHLHLGDWVRFDATVSEEGEYPQVIDTLELVESKLETKKDVTGGRFEIKTAITLNPLDFKDDIVIGCSDYFGEVLVEINRWRTLKMDVLYVGWVTKIKPLDEKIHWKITNITTADKKITDKSGLINAPLHRSVKAVSPDDFGSDLKPHQDERVEVLILTRSSDTMYFGWAPKLQTQIRLPYSLQQYQSSVFTIGQWVTARLENIAVNDETKCKLKGLDILPLETSPPFPTVVHEKRIVLIQVRVELPEISEWKTNKTFSRGWSKAFLGWVEFNLKRVSDYYATKSVLAWVMKIAPGLTEAEWAIKTSNTMYRLSLADEKDRNEIENENEIKKIYEELAKKCTRVVSNIQAIVTGDTQHGDRPGFAWSKPTGGCIFPEKLTDKCPAPALGTWIRFDAGHRAIGWAVLSFKLIENVLPTEIVGSTVVVKTTLVGRANDHGFISEELGVVYNRKKVFLSERFPIYVRAVSVKSFPYYPSHWAIYSVIGNRSYSSVVSKDKEDGREELAKKTASISLQDQKSATKNQCQTKSLLKKFLENDTLRNGLHDTSPQLLPELINYMHSEEC